MKHSIKNGQQGPKSGLQGVFPASTTTDKGPPPRKRWQTHARDPRAYTLVSRRLAGKRG